MARSLALPQYSAGTIAIAETSGVWTVTGIGTNFVSPDGVTNWTVAVGDMLICNGALGIVGAVISSTNMTLSFWSGATIAAGAAYVINRLSPVASSVIAGLVSQLLSLVADYTPQVVSASATVSAPGLYLITTAGVTITLASNWPVGGRATIKDMTGSSNPNITVTGTIDGASSSYVISLPSQSKDFASAPGATSCYSV